LSIREGPNALLPQNPGTCKVSSKDYGKAGPRERAQFGTPSLNPGLWYYLVSSQREPPSSEKNENTRDRDR